MKENKFWIKRLFAHPKWISIQRAHHGHEERLLQQCKKCANEGLHSCQTAKLRGRVPAPIKKTIVL